MTGNDDFYRIIIPVDGYFDEYYSVLEFKEYLTAENLSSEVFRYGWVFWAPERDDQGGRSIREKIRRVLNRLMSSSCSLTYMVQFWVSMEVGSRFILTTSDQPFAVMNCLRKGESWYRKKCTDHHYSVEDGAENEQLGPPGRVFRNGRPESSPDIRNYTVKEFPLRDHAANCGERSYLALPVFDLLHDQYVGVLEIVSDDYGADILSCGSDICRELEEVEMRTTHIDHWEQLSKDPLKKNYLINHDLLMYHHQQPSEIIEMLELASNAIPQLHLAQVMAPCEQCGTSSKSFNCMKLVASMLKKKDDELLRYFFMASKFHNLQNGRGIGGFALSSANKSLFCQNVSDLSISDYTTVHYARDARLSLCFAICLRDMLHRENSDNDLYVFEFFLQRQSRDPTNIWFVLHLLLKLMEDTLRSFEVATGRHLAENLITDEIRRTYMPPSSILGQNDMFPSGIEVIPYGLKTVHRQNPILFSVPMEGCDESYPIFELREYLRKPNLHCVQEKGSEYGFSCYCTEDDELLENGDYNDSVSEFISTPYQKIKILTGKLIPCWGSHNYLIQFWAPKMIKNRLYLSTSDHPFVLGHLGRGLCWYRKQCMEHLYHVGDGAKEEELGPPGRVFLTGQQESSLDLRLYSTREFPLLVHVIHCCARDYIVLPLFDVQQKYCFGVLECVGIPCCSLDFIVDKLKEVDLRSTHVNYGRPSLNIDNRRKLAVAEIEEMFQLLYGSAQLQLASAWVPCSQCATSNIIGIFCMERVCDIQSPAFRSGKFLKVNIGKGLTGRVLESKNKMGYFENLGDFSILEYPWAHHAQTYRLEFCFVICLQSSHTANDLYVLEFFISPGSEKDGYPWSYLSFLLSTMKIYLKSFKVASGQQLGEHFFQATGSGKEVYFGHEPNIIGTNSNEKNPKDESKTSFYISYEDLEPHFGKRLEDVANDLGVSRSTLKRACKDCGIKRWPSKMKNKKNPSLFLKNSSSKRARSYDQRIFEPSRSDLPISNLPSQPNVPLTCIHSSREVDKTHQENDVVMIKAHFNEDIIKFDLCLSSGLEKLVEEVAKRLDLVIENLKLKYKDDDDDLILLTCNEDLHYCVKSMRSLGKRTMHVLVCSVSK